MNSKVKITEKTHGPFEGIVPYKPLNLQDYQSLSSEDRLQVLAEMKAQMGYIDPNSEQDVFQIVAYSLIEQNEGKMESLGVLFALFEHEPQWAGVALDEIEKLLTENMWFSRSAYIGAVTIRAVEADPGLEGRAIAIADKLSQYDDAAICEVAGDLRRSVLTPDGLNSRL